MRKYFLAALAAIGLLFVGIAPASAAEVPTWVTNQESAITSPTTALLKGTNTSVETTDLDRPIQTGQAVTVEFELGEGATCTAGAPRIFIELDGTYVNSWDQGDNACADGVLTVTAPNNGRIGAAGIVYDNGTIGEVRLNNLKVNGELVLFQEEPEPTETPTPDPTVTSTPDPTTPPTNDPDPTTPPEPDLCASYEDATWCEEGVSDYNCTDIPLDSLPVILVGDEDPFDLDGNNNGLGCEGLVTPSPDPTDPPSPTAAPTATPTPPGATGDDGEELPDTGPETLWMAIAGLGLLGAGTLVMLRNRTQ